MLALLGHLRLSHVCAPNAVMILAAFSVTMLAAPAPSWGQAGEAKRGYLVDVPMPLTSDDVGALLRQLRNLGESTGEGERTTVVLRYSAEAGDGAETTFEDALRLARAITAPELRRIKVVSLVETEVRGHSILPILASDSLLVSPSGVIADASAAEEIMDETVELTYGSIARRRSLFPPAVVAALIDPSLELALVSKVGGEQVFASGDQLQQLRESGDVLKEDIWSAAGTPLRLGAERLRTARIAAGVVDTVQRAAEVLDLAELNTATAASAEGEASGVLLEISGSIASNRSRRWQSNLAATLQSGEINTWLVAIDSSGGDLSESASLAGWFARPEPPLQTVAGVIRGEARGDAALVALACKPLLMTPDATLGGPGSDAIGADDVQRQAELIEQIAEQAQRPAALIRGLLDRDLVVYRYTHRRTGRVRYATEQGLVEGAEDPEAEAAQWQRGEVIDLAEGLSASQAIALGLADAETESLESAARRVGLDGVPEPVADRKIIRFVEQIGRSNGLAFLLLFIGFITLSSEASAPGLGVPGFVSMLCFAFYFWIKFLAGTAEWLELLAFVLGIACIALEVFLLPGFGIFGIGGLALTMLGVVLMSQTFVIPRNVYQLEVLTQGIWIALGGLAGMIGGVVAVRTLMPHVPVLRGLVMEMPDATLADAQERLADYAYLKGQTGIATTPLRPSGKVRFGETIVGVVSDGSAVAPGDAVRVVEVYGNRIVVEAIES